MPSQAWSGSGGPKLRVAFIHPDLGIGGAERLVVDAAAELANRGHSVHIFTAHHNPKRCFPETVDGTCPVTVYGDFLPRHVFRFFHALCAYVRCVWVALCMVLLHAAEYDVVFADQVSAVIPILRWRRGTKILFYCHFPDLLLAKRGSAWGAKALYRAPIDWLEESTTGMADCVVVNSNFTAQTFKSTFRRLAARGLTPSVLYPAVAVPDRAELARLAPGTPPLASSQLSAIFGFSSKPYFLSLNRFERKKGIETAIRALGIVKGQHAAGGPETEGGAAGAASLAVQLVVAGGYDVRVRENVEYLEELQGVAQAEGVGDAVHFLTSVSDSQKAELLGSALAVLYTPENEHFGLVPLEAMGYGVPVVACNSGGPRESILDSKTGFLCDPTPVAFGVAMVTLLGDEGRRRAMGAAARERVEAAFSRKQFGDQLEEVLQGL